MKFQIPSTKIIEIKEEDLKNIVRVLEGRMTLVCSCGYRMLNMGDPPQIFYEHITKCLPNLE